MDRRRVLLITAGLVAVLGLALVVVYARGADQRAEQRFATAPVLQVTGVIEAGESIADALDAGKVATADVAEGDRLPTAYTEPGALDSASVALTTLFPGEQLIPEKLGDAAATGPQLLIPDTGELAISVNLTDPARVAGFVSPGSEVSVFVTTTGYSRLLLERVRVLGVGSTTPVTATTDEDGQPTAEQLPKTLITLSLTQKQAEKVLFAQSIGELAVALLTAESDVEPGDPTGPGNLFG
jgi:pilus assembly protein CpaB